MTYIKTDKTGVTTITSDPISRNEKGVQMTVVPCTLYTFRNLVAMSGSSIILVVLGLLPTRNSTAQGEDLRCSRLR